MEEKNKELETDNRKEFSWHPLWIAGFLFTLGITGVPDVLFTYSIWQQAIIWIISYIIWPLTLGMHLSGIQ